MGSFENIKGDPFMFSSKGQGVIEKRRKLTTDSGYGDDEVTETLELIIDNSLDRIDEKLNQRYAAEDCRQNIETLSRCYEKFSFDENINNNIVNNFGGEINKPKVKRQTESNTSTKNVSNSLCETITV